MPPEPDDSARAEPRLARLLTFLRGEATRKVLALIALSLGVALLVVEDQGLSGGALEVGEVAGRDVRAPVAFQFADASSTEVRAAEAEAAVLPVFDLDTNLLGRVRSKITSAFDLAAQRYSEGLLAARAAGQSEVPPELISEISRDFVKVLEVTLDPNDLALVVNARWDRRVERVARDLVGVALSGYVIPDRSQLPSPPRPLSVVRIVQSSRDEVRLDSYEGIRTPDEARQAISLYALEHAAAELDAERLRAAVAIARASVRPNLFYNQLMTEERRSSSRAEVTAVVMNVPRGFAIVREGEVVTPQQVEMLRQLTTKLGGRSVFDAMLGMAALCAMVFTTLYGFGTLYIRRFSTSLRDIVSVSALVLIVLSLGQILRSAGPPLAELIGFGMEPRSFLYLVPIAGGAMLVRILVNAETSLLFVLPTAVLASLMAGDELLSALYFVIVGVAGVGAVAQQDGERLGVLKAGLQTGLVGGVAALLLGLASAPVGDPTGGSGSLQTLWDVGFAILGGLLSAFMVLALVPIFEMVGYLTDYKLLELANLNHPLIRQLMLRAPGSYHHSIIVATLSEAAAQKIGGNALLTRVCCYFHDVGKALKPQYFIENQRSGPSRHASLEPRVSSRIIINHVLDGAAIARQYKLPEPIVNGIFMHHGTGLIQYFYAKALEGAGPGEAVDEQDFRYPGPRPDTREHGIIMLADKVEAACRSIKEPTPEKMREMIQKVVNGTIEDGQLEDCPLTLSELYAVIETFTHTLVGIYHQRIEYPGLPRRGTTGLTGGSNTSPGTSRGAVITLEMPSPFGRRGDTLPPDSDPDEDGEVAVGKA